jgi:hypothetical protein
MTFASVNSTVPWAFATAGTASTAINPAALAKFAITLLPVRGDLPAWAIVCAARMLGVRILLGLIRDSPEDLIHARGGLVIERLLRRNPEIAQGSKAGGNDV